MQLHNNKMLTLLVGLVAIVSTGCQSAARIPVARVPNPMAATLSACQKADAMWNGKIVPSRYEQLPPLISPGISDLYKLTTGDFSVKALTTQGDELEPGRHKRIHAFGAEARLRLVVRPDAPGGYTGIFKSGAQCVIGRFSMASKPTASKSIPALALKIFIGGDQSSVNVHLMHSVDGQAGHNFFGQTFSTILPPANGLATRVLGSGFERSAVQFGAKDPNPGRLTLEHLAATLPDGQRVLRPKAPNQLLYKPTARARALMQDASAEDDFRLKLAGLAVGQAVYDIYTLAEGDPPENARILGQLVLAAPVLSSRYGDEKLYFQHNMARK